MVSVLASSAADRGSSQSRVSPKTMQLIYVASPLSTQFQGVKEITIDSESEYSLRAERHA